LHSALIAGTNQDRRPAAPFTPTGKATDMDKILRGFRQFHDRVFPKCQTEFERMANRQQNPIALFITCSDSRVNPNLITQTDPGDLFLLRNAGNIVPPYGAVHSGEAATIEYAVSVLGIRNIIVCGHSRCGAMHALLRPADHANLPAVSEWFAHAETTRRIAEATFQGMDGDELETRVVQQNVLNQLNNLRTHPSVAVGLAQGQLKLFGWYYRIETGDVLGYSPEAGGFVSLADSVTPLDEPRPDCMLEAATLDSATAAG
jgi:carbonic anhydrase